MTNPGADSLLVQMVEVGAIEEDPNQPRKQFSDADLEELAADIENVADGSPRPWETGLLHPIVVYPRPGWVDGAAGPRYRILSGARRYRAYKLREWPAIPARIVSSPRNAARALMTQLIENLSRKDTSLFEEATAVQDAWDTWRMENPGGTQGEFAKVFRKSVSWVSRHLAAAQSTGLARTAAIEGCIRHAEAHSVFCRLPYELQRELLRQARESGSVITLRMVKSLLPKKRKRGGGKSSGGAATEPAEVRPREPITFHFRFDQVRFLLDAVGTEAPKDDRYLEAALIMALNFQGASPPGDTKRKVRLRLRFRDMRWLLSRLGTAVPENDAELEAALQTALTVNQTA